MRLVQSFKELPTVLQEVVKEYYVALPDRCWMCEEYCIVKALENNTKVLCETCERETECKCGREMGMYEYFAIGQCVDCEHGDENF